MGDVNVFGNLETGLGGGSLLYQTKQKRGVLKDYIGMIRYTQYLGLQPFLEEDGDIKPVKVKKKRVFCDGNDVTSSVLSPKRTLTIYDTKRAGHHTFAFFSIKGTDGKNGFDALTWFPSQMLSIYRREEQLSLYFDDDKSGLIIDKKGRVVGLKNHSSPLNNAMCARDFEGVVQLPTKKYAVLFTNSLYRVKNIGLANINNFSVVIIITFKVHVLPTRKQLLFGTMHLERGIMLRKNQIEILGSADYRKIPYEVGQYNTLFIVFHNNGNRSLSYYDFNDGDDCNYFETNRCATDPPPNTVYIGADANPEERYLFDGEIAALEIFQVSDIPAQFPSKLKEADNHREKVEII